MKTVDIVGTCLTRELFNHTEQYKVKTYIMQQSIYSINSNAYKVEKEDIKITDNFPFKVRMIYYDFNKIAFDVLKENPSEYLIIDLADQSRDIILLEDYDNVILTATSAVKETLNNLNIKYKLFNIDNFTKEELYYYISEFVKLIIPLYDPKKIILNKVQLQNQYYEDNELKYVNQDISVLKRIKQIELLEDILLTFMPETKVLISKYPPIIDINHRLGGPHPGHFEQLYYKYRMELLDALINDKDKTPIDIKYQEEYISALPNIKKKTRKN